MIPELEVEHGIPGAVKVSSGKNGLPRVQLSHASGAGANVYLHGGQVTSWTTPAGEELLFVSSQSHFTSGKPIRGGIPVCFPQFGGGTLPQHGFARTTEWQLAHTARRDSGAVSVKLRLEEQAKTLALWPHRFLLELEVTLEEKSLLLDVRVENRGGDPFGFTFALHTYFGVADIRQAAVLGLDGVTFIDSLRNDIREVETRPEIRFDQETDRIYENAPDSVRLRDEGHGRTIRIAKAAAVRRGASQGMPDYVVWNPWIAKAQRMADFGDDEYQRMLCIETGSMVSPLALAAGQEWKGETTFSAEEARP